jgi:hypothetical protein
VTVEYNTTARSAPSSPPLTTAGHGGAHHPQRPTPASMPSGALMPHQRTRSSPHDPNDPRNAPEGFITVYWAVRSFPTSNGGRGVKDARRREVPGHRTQIPPGAITDTLEVTPQGFTDRHRGFPANENAPPCAAASPSALEFARSNWRARVVGSRSLVVERRAEGVWLRC